MIKRVYYSVANAIGTIFYFIGYGFSYGTTLGFVAGTGFFPVIGTLVGCFVGMIVGLSSGFLLGVGVLIAHTLFFDRDTDLERYRLWLARGVGIFITAFALIAVFLILDSERYYQYPQYHAPLEWVFLVIIGGTGLLWTVLSSAYTASYYPDYIVARLIRQRKLEIDDSMIQHDHQEMMLQSESDILFNRIITPRILAIVSILAALMILFMLSWLNVPLSQEGVAPAVCVVFLAISVAVVCWLTLSCVGIGNAALIVFLKRVVLPEMPPHRHRVTLTLISFFYTLVTHWWTLIFVPLIALFIAHHVYHTLALPDYQSDKAKRKEAGMMVG